MRAKTLNDNASASFQVSLAGLLGSSGQGPQASVVAGSESPPAKTSTLLQRHEMWRPTAKTWNSSFYSREFLLFICYYIYDALRRQTTVLYDNRHIVEILGSHPGRKKDYFIDPVPRDVLRISHRNFVTIGNQLC